MMHSKFYPRLARRILSTFSLSSLILLISFACKHENRQRVIENLQVSLAENSAAITPCDKFEIPTYTCYKTTSEIKVDGHLDESDWKSAPKSSRFRDLVSGAEMRYDTRAAVLWDDEYLYVAYWVEEPKLQASITKRDGYIYEDNDVELFVAGKDAYYEFEINAYGTIYEVFFVWMEAYREWWI